MTRPSRSTDQQSITSAPTASSARGQAQSTGEPSDTPISLTGSTRSRYATPVPGGLRDRSTSRVRTKRGESKSPLQEEEPAASTDDEAMPPSDDVDFDYSRTIDLYLAGNSPEGDLVSFAQALSMIREWIRNGHLDGKLEVTSLHLGGPGNSAASSISQRRPVKRRCDWHPRQPLAESAYAFISEPTPDDQLRLYSPAAQGSPCHCIVQWSRNRPHSLSNPIRFVGNGLGEERRVIVQEIN
ncbi:hypothetical protein BDN70DRAFT_939650 [Pholiota conissans]|uniref:Uncharacterized protein n=1 Tax=Pholiota conissans TaxID=109636 RepID=A0A9P5YMF9_9AGAR|nr:hypothetical protein BDN70DRAFT_939650 [Pholiota conissans]